MKVFKVWVDNVGYDQFDSAVIVAKNEQEIKESFITDQFGTRIYVSDREDSGCLYFRKEQGEIHIKEVDLTKSGLICTSFRGE